MSEMAKTGTSYRLLAIAVILVSVVKAQVSTNEISSFSLSPPYFNLASTSRISATATCGEDELGRPRSDLYCKLVGGPTTGLHSQTIQGQFCDHCNSNDPNKAHPVTNAIDGTESWWQSPPLSRGLEYNEVNVTLDLGQLFHVAYVLIKFANSPRPDLWVLERSVDHGRTFTPWQYFAHSKRECIERFGKQPNVHILGDDEQVCTTEYSRIVPLENGEVVVSLVNGRPGSRNFTYSPVLRDFTKATNIRLHFLRTSTLLGHLISKAQRDPSVTRRYYYSIKDISVGGRCVCHGHAQECGGHFPGSQHRLQCDCKHNTCGESCDRCCPGYNQKPWRPATADNANECQPCQCHSHATDCYYDPEVERRRASLDIYGRYDGGGVCLNCQHNTAGVNCELCAEGYYRPYGVPRESLTGCIPCRCDLQTTQGCEMGSGRCICRPEFSGDYCDRCADGYYGYPRCIRHPVYPATTKSPSGNIKEPTVCPAGFFGAPSCRPCWCERQGTVPEVCGASGHCLCRPGIVGERCDRCHEGYHSFPYCQECRCDGHGVADRSCGPRGECRCQANFAGQQCDQCATGYYGYPYCSPCRCSPEGSRGDVCDPASGQCVCRPAVAGQHCDHCTNPGLLFPHCTESTPAPNSQCNPAGSEVGVKDPQGASCVCLRYVEGPLCDLCKPLYWNLARDNLDGCIECTCDDKGTLSGVGECQQETGECYCKPNTCSHSCNICKESHFLLQRKNYFGCRGCQCDVGGAVGSGCDDQTGQCQCRKNIQGRTCTEPEPNFYFPSLHHLKFEVENGVTPNARPVRFGYNPQEFPEFSWRGYAIMSPAQSEVIVNVHVDEARHSPFRLLLRYVNPGGAAVPGRITASRSRGGAAEGRDLVFPPSRAPSLLTAPGDGFAQPFTLSPGRWYLHIRAEGVLLDYLVLLPSDYYEAPILQERVADPCTYTRAEQDRSCLLYKHVPMERFPAALGSEGRLSVRGRRRRQTRTRRPTADHPEMASISGRQAQLELTLHVPRPGQYVVVLEYASELDMVQNANLHVRGHTQEDIHARVNIYSCSYSFLCRSAAVDRLNRVARLQMSHRAQLLLHTSTASFLLYKVYAVPAEEFSMEYVEPKVLCVSTHGRFTEDSQACVRSQYPSVSSAVLLHPAASSYQTPWPPGPPPASAPRGDGVLLKSPQTEVTVRGRVAAPGRFVFVLHTRQPEHTAFPVEVLIDAGRTWTGWLNASFCPALAGCRSVFIAQRSIAMEMPQTELAVTLRIPPGKTLTLDYILAVPDDRYTPDLLKEKPLDKSSDFIAQCGEESFQIDPGTACEFCRTSARSLAARYHDGALPCHCDASGSTSPTCDPAGGQCPCRPHAIGRQCTRCATGFYGFPYCRPCECGRRLCDEVTGECICPPQTVRPACDACESQTFSYHPLVGCEVCDCSPTGISSGAGGQCDFYTGQCTCKPRIGGRQCDRCAAGYYRFPECVPCDCEAGGVRPEVCDPNTGQCLCKRNVEGERCDSCRRGSFHFDASSPTGCTDCFCFGATNQCHSSSKRRGKFVDMRSWRLQKADQEEVPSVLNPVSNMVVADVQELPRSVHSLHWVAPASYLGDRVSSYGGYLTYQIKSFGIPSEGMLLLDKRPDVLLRGDQMTLVYSDPQSPDPDRLYQGRVQLVEGNLRHAGTRRPVTRPELLRLLSALEELRLRALHFTQSQRLSLGEVGLEEASADGRGGPASTVELCSCPTPYSGDSCQRCARGFHRDRSGQLPGRCLPCSCNGLSDECEEGTGRCLNCQHNTAGDHCERCQEGYYGNAAQRTCRLCPCPHNVASNNFAVGCREVLGGFQCTCKPGYTGERCESCAPGYYGDPLAYGSSCRPCNCNGNPGHCDSKTGVCKNTLEPKDTNTDEDCQECDNCAQTLLNDLDKLDDELVRIKSQLEKANASSTSQERLKKLEEAITAAKMVVNTFTSTVTRRTSKVTELEQDTQTLKDDINQLKKQAEKKEQNATKALDDVEDTYERAKTLHSQAENMFKKIQELLKLLQDASLNGDSVAPEQLAKMLEVAERLVREMEGRHLKNQKDAAEKEREQARKLLDYIKNNVTMQCDQNQEAAKRIEDLLKNYDAKLKDLENALKQAKELVAKANTQNNDNSKTMEDLLNRIKDLEKERDKVADQMTMAREELKSTGDLLKTLDNSKQEYERLAAQLDGAKTDLTKRVNEISQAAAKEPIVKRAEEHAQRLSDLAEQLEKAVNDSSSTSDVRNALAAIDAYKSITDAINAAEQAAKEAKDAADKAFQDVDKKNLVQKAKNLKDKGTKLVTAASGAEQELKLAEADLAKQKKRLEDAKNKKQALEKDLQKAEDELKGIQRGDIANMIDEAKKAAASANNTATDAMDRLNDIKKEVEKIDASPGQSNLDSVLNDVDKSVKNLSSTIPSLLDKINQIEELSSQAGPIANVSENIKRIKELIEQARDAANRVVVPVKFNGNSHVELRPPKNLEDLRAYTTLSLLLQRPGGRGDGKRRRRQAGEDDGNLFVLYLGKEDASSDYIGMALKENVLYTYYKLNGREYEIKSKDISFSESEPAMFDKVDLYRIYQDAKVNLTKSYTSSKPEGTVSFTNKGQHIKNLLDIDPNNVVFYVGGYPDSFTPPDSLNFPKYKGCIELSSFNERFISLYNFQKAVNIGDTPCKRYVPTGSAEFFEGTGYAKVDLKKFQSSNNLRLQQHVTTRSGNGMLFFIANGDSYYSVSLEEGHFVLRGRAEGQDLAPQRSEKKVTPMEKEVMVVLNRLRKEIQVIYPYPVLKGTFIPEAFSSYYIGGVPQELKEKFNVQIPPLKGCVTTVKVNGGHAPFEEKVGVSRGCPHDFLASRKAEFIRGSSLSLEEGLDSFSLAGDFMVSLGFRSTEANGLLLTESSQGTGLELSMVNGHVVLNFSNTVFKSQKKYQDGKWHYVTARKNGASIELQIDETDAGQQQPGTTKLGGTTSIFLGKTEFKGCLSNFYTRRPDHLYLPEDLSTYTSTGSVLLDMCTAERPPEKTLASRNHSLSRKDNKKEMKDQVSGCSLPTQVKQAYYLGGVASGLTYKVSKQDLQNKTSFSLDVRTTSAEGLLFYVGSDVENSHLALYMSSGRIRLSVRRRREIFNREKYNDGKWHTVIFSLEKRKFRLLVDGIRAQDGTLTHEESSDVKLISPLYLGACPASLHTELKWKNLPKQNVIGCVRNFKINGLPAAPPTTNHGVGPCFDGQTESGSYFSGNGGYAIIDESFIVGESFELVFEFRPRNLTGVLLHVGNLHHLSLYMRRGEVVAQVNNGAGIFSVSVQPKQSLCDGVFHRVAVIKRKNVVEMHVDTDGNYTIGPASSITTMTKDPLYVGGIPGTFKGVALPIRTSFTGCIQNMQINGDLVAFERLPKVFGSVNLRECPAG